METKRVWLYSRSFTDEDEPLSKQSERLLRHARHNGYKVINSTFDKCDGEGCYQRLNNMTGFAYRGTIDAIIVTSLTSVSNDDKTAEKFVNYVAELGVEVIALDALEQENGNQNVTKKMPYVGTASLGASKAALMDCTPD